MKTYLEPFRPPVIDIDIKPVPITIDLQIVTREVKAIGAAFYWPVMVCLGVLCVLMAYQIYQNYFLLSH